MPLSFEFSICHLEVTYTNIHRIITLYRVPNHSESRSLEEILNRRRHSQGRIPNDRRCVTCNTSGYAPVRDFLNVQQLISSLVSTRLFNTTS